MPSEECIGFFTAFEDLAVEWQDWPMVLKMKWNRLTEIQGRTYS